MRKTYLISKRGEYYSVLNQLSNYVLTPKANKVVQKGIALIAIIGEKKEIYLPQKFNNGIANDLIKVFDEVSDFKYYRGLLFIERDKTWTIISPEDFINNLSLETLETKKKTLPMIDPKKI